MKKFKLIFSFIVFSCMTSVISAQVNVQGNISFSTTWTKALSPYNVVGDVQVPSGVTLTIEPGVEIRYTGNYELLVKGKLLANGAPADTIVFRSDVSGTKKGKRFLNFEGTNLATHQVSYVKMLDGNTGIQVGNESESAQGDKNTGKLVVNHINIKNTDILTKGYSTGAQLSINYGTIETAVIRGSYPLSEKILLKGLSIKNSTLSSDSYNVGLTLDSCNVQGGQITVGCCGANIEINRSELQGLNIVEGGGSPVTGPFKINSTKMLNCSFNLPNATVEIRNSIINTGSGKLMTFGNGLVDGTAITGNGTGNGLTITGYNGYNIGGTISVTNSTITNFDKGIQITGANTVTIQHNNILANKTFNIENTSTTPINATYNWWGTTDEIKIGELLWDKSDDINKGEISHTNSLTSPYISAPVILPLNVTKQLSGNTVIVKWKANNETDISGYKIYYGSTDGIHFLHVINAGKVSADTLSNVSFNDSIAVTAYDINADGLNDQIEGHESWYSRAGLPKAQISLSSASIIMGAVQLNSTVSKKLLIANNGTSDLTISNIVLSSNMFAVNKTSFTVKPDSTCELQVLFTPTSLGQKSGTITI